MWFLLSSIKAQGENKRQTVCKVAFRLNKLSKATIYVQLHLQYVFDTIIFVVNSITCLGIMCCHLPLGYS